MRKSRVGISQGLSKRFVFFDPLFQTKIDALDGFHWQELDTEVIRVQYYTAVY